MIKRLARTVVLGAGLAVANGQPACADPAVANGGSGRLPAQYAVVQSSGTTVMQIAGTPARVFLGVLNLNTASQISALTCYDSNSGASGPVVFNSLVGLVSSPFPHDGIALVNGLVCQVSTSLLGAGVAIYYR